MALHLRQKGGCFHVRVMVPRHLRRIAGKSWMNKSLGRCDLSTANRLKWPIVGAMREQIGRYEREFRGKKKVPSAEFSSVLKVIDDYGDLIQFLRLRRRELGIAHVDCDEDAGFAQGHTAKIETGQRNLSGKSMKAYFEVLGVKLQIVGEPVSAESRRLNR